jgi:hypothetical protein
MRPHLLIALMALISAGVGMPAAAQQGQASDEQVVVVGRPTEEVVREFVDELAISAQAQNQLSRWDRRICPGVAGLRTRYAQFVIDRLAQRALDVGLDVGERGCDANVLIVVTPNPDAVARDLTQNHRRAMGYYQERLRSTLGRSALAAFARSDAPVRWWHVSRTASADGEEIEEPSPSVLPPSGNTMFMLTMKYPTVIGGGSSRLARRTRQDFGAAFVIVDAHRLPDIGHDFAALADYVAMVTLAQVDPDADTSSYPTILNLFRQNREAEPVRALTDWDIAYLRALYDITREERSASAQEGEIARSMNRDLTAPAN